jgi:hypothetical protein
MYEKLFGSKTRAKLLTLFFTNTDKAFYVREITRKIDEQINSVRRELANLKSLDLVVCQQKRGKLYYSVNRKSEIHGDLKKLFNKITKEKPAEEDMTKSIKKLGDVSYAALLGHFVKDSTSALDLFIVGKVDRKKLKTFVSRLEVEAKRELNFSTMTVDEYENRKLIFDRFLTEVLASPKQVIVDYLEAVSDTNVKK